jgi:molybdopterin-containing oxidoreductase family iron-sulfur binding subunit
MSAIWFGDLVRDIATNGLETVQLSWLLSSRNAFRLKEELGTRPRVWYLPGHGEQSKVVLPA